MNLNYLSNFINLEIYHQSFVFSDADEFIDYYDYVKSKNIQGHESLLQTKVKVKSNSPSFVINSKSDTLNLQEYIILTNQFEKFKKHTEFYKQNNSISYPFLNIVDLTHLNKVEILENVLTHCNLSEENNNNFIYKWLLYCTNKEVEQLGYKRFKSLVEIHKETLNTLDKTYSNIVNSLLQHKNSKGLAIVLENFNIKLNEMWFSNEERCDFLPLFQVKDSTCLKILSQHKDFNINLIAGGSTVCDSVDTNFVEFTEELYRLGFNFTLLDCMPSYKNETVTHVKSALQSIKEREALQSQIISPTHKNTVKQKI